ncbi:MAG: hydrogenase formation protein HypD [Candidatus Omnitrophota bacterium]|jgi:hydrogenase expression/formation protein HypD|nr:hydrogenase formation protein HypD [Candidatus Omnitrophota bacterium]MDD5517749.1 hydrogenase formation protein HypD [Candidatus Omnitrophota bacterium]
MKYVDEFRNAKLVRKLSARINSINPGNNLNIMEVCGTHTQNFCRFGLAKLLPKNIRLISGPGCPVCVSPQGYIDAAIKLAKNKDVLIVTFGDMLCVPGSVSSLEKERAKFGNVRVAYSPLDALSISRDNPDKKVVFLAVGFETTAPTIALSVMEAKKESLKNLFFLSSLKLIPAAMHYLLLDKKLKVDGFLCPGHVSAVIGIKDYAFIPKKYKIPCCVAGFEPVDILEGIDMILEQIVTGNPYVANQYTRVVAQAGNPRAKEIIRRVFKISDSRWRGLGIIPGSGLKLKDEFSGFDAGRIFSVASMQNKAEPVKRCRCSEVLKGLISPPGCPLFGRRCQPDNPFGPCMVSNEGACNAYYKFRQ